MSTSEHPPAELLTPARVRALLRWISPRIARLPASVFDGLPALILEATRLPSRDPLDPGWVRFADGVSLPAAIDGGECRCSDWLERGHCGHRAALLLLELWRRPQGRALFELPSWQLELDYLLPEHGLSDDDRRKQTEDQRRPCRFRVQLFATGGYAQGFDLDIRLIRSNKRGDGWLKPGKLPRSHEALLAKAAPSEALLRIHELEASLDELRKLDGFSRRAPRLRSRLAHDLLVAFAAAQAHDEIDLLYEDQPIRVETAPWQPSMRLLPRAGGGLEARWTEGLIDRWLLEPPIVLRAGDGSAGVLCPVAAAVPNHVLERVDDTPVLIEAGSFDALARTILARSTVAIEVPEPARIGASAVARREARLFLEERGEVIRVRGRLAYELADGRCLEIDPDDHRALTLGEDLTVIRERDWEAARWAELRRALDRRGALDPAGVEQIGDEAWRFLIDGLAGLREAGWVVFGEAHLAHNRVLRESLRPQLRLGPSTDWFELEVDFAGGGQTLPAAEVIASWLAGERFVRLADARVAALPARWLERHGAALAELVELQAAAGDRGLGSHALPLAAGLLDELVSDDPQQHARASHWRSQAHELAAFDGIDDRPPPPGLQATLRPYQRRGFAWLCFLRDRGLGGCLADDMGLGKTVQALALLLDSHGADSHADAKSPPSLVVCPTSVLHTWREQAARFAPSLRVHVHHGARRGPLPADGEVDVIATSYALLRRDAPLLQARRFRHLILDEAQALKNPDSQLTQAARGLVAAHPLALSGTPLENHLLELWSLFELLMPGFFGSKRRFRRRWAEPVHKREDAATLARLRRRLRPFLLRRLKREVADELPPKQEQVLRCRLGREQRLLYERVRETYRASVLGAVDARGLGGAHLHILEALTRLRQACCHPALLPFPEARALAGARAAKIDLLRLLLGEAVADGHRSLVFSQWPSFLDHVAAALDQAGIAFLRLDGRTRDRSAVLDRWQDPAGPPVFLISTKAGGVGLDLSAADHVFHLDPWWNPATEDQATDRAHRIGQTRPVMVYKLVAADTVEDKILELQARKRRLFQATVDADRLEVDALSRADLEAVFAPEIDPRQGDDDDDPDDDFLILERNTLEREAALAEDEARAYRAQFVPLVAAEESAAPPEAPEDANEAGADVIELFPRR